ncbi:MAG: polysaccharide deacetylase family protein [Terracidiphilus sp.]|nr:polysaccharide deacetylase family protein [Terracidiphilus sp.]
MTIKPLKISGAAAAIAAGLFFNALAFCGFAQSAVQNPTYAEKLGWKAGDRVVIIHIDDGGMSHDSDVGIEKSLDYHLATSFSVMMPCPWVPEIVHYIHAHPGVDAGLHLTLTSEWAEYRWGPVAGPSEVPGLVDKEGALWKSAEETAQHASADEFEKEIRAQLKRARNMGFTPTHLDTHMGTVYARPDYLERYVKVGVENHIPIMFPGGHDALLAEQFRNEAIVRLKESGKWVEGTKLPEDPAIAQARLLGQKVWESGLPVLDDLYNFSYDWKFSSALPPTDENVRAFKVGKYKEVFHQLKPGVTQIIIHATDTSDSFKFISSSGVTRRGDFLAMTSAELREAAQKDGLILTTWRELQERRDRVSTKQ